VWCATDPGGAADGGDRLSEGGRLGERVQSLAHQGPAERWRLRGILGIRCIITFLTLRTRRDIPAGFRQRRLHFWGVITLFGLVFHEWIDNWAHLEESWP
jgi:hypothetical protein